MSSDQPVTVVTGAGGGLGRSYAHALASAGHRVVVNDLGTTRDGSGSSARMADTVVDEIRRAGGTAVADYSSVATREGVQALVDTAVAEFGRIDAAISNAGILRDAAFHKMTDEQWNAVLDVHLQGTRLLSSILWPRFREQGSGRLVFATSSAGLFGQFGQANYASAKLGMIGLMNVLAIEGARYGITVNAVAPLASTRMTEGVAPPELLEKLSPDLVAPIVVRLASACTTETGLVLVVGGGKCYRVQQFQNSGVQFNGVPTQEDVDKQWDTIVDMSDATIALNPV